MVSAQKFSTVNALEIIEPDIGAIAVLECHDMMLRDAKAGAPPQQIMRPPPRLRPRANLGHLRVEVAINQPSSPDLVVPSVRPLSLLELSFTHAPGRPSGPTLPLVGRHVARREPVRGAGAHQLLSLDFLASSGCRRALVHPKLGGARVDVMHRSSHQARDRLDVTVWVFRPDDAILRAYPAAPSWRGGFAFGLLVGAHATSLRCNLGIYS